MKGYVVAIFLSSIFLYYVLYCILWGTNGYWFPNEEMKSKNNVKNCFKKPAFASLLRFPQFYPFLCKADFVKVAATYGTNNFLLPYGVKTFESYFRSALSKLQSCDLFGEFDTCREKIEELGLPRLEESVLSNKTTGKTVEDSGDFCISHSRKTRDETGQITKPNSSRR
ncbi:type 2 lactosamine alpha-2,3-sialyltransferase isoform X4 [Rattus norvegicus]|uniref:type 2 lactosamine alpha-2,3-sialyltransferase isoform X4 n=1 Tax=Rattus norvegicus TaxID=10116 RepID=UPI0019172EF6|nr:type 2 lactosamine alpha-2,3-sialyltransferase isoform X3 [Rattus norvegicus]